MGTTPTVYRWDDPGAPARPTSNSNASKLNYLAEILRAALVDGYGNKTAAGWAELFFQPEGSGAMQQVLQNGEQTGVVSLARHSTDRLGGTEVGTGWDGSAVAGSAGQEQYIGRFSFFADVRSSRWAIIGNDCSAVLVFWRDPAALSGDGLSNHNMIVLTLGSMLPWGSSIDPRAVPNFAVTSTYRSAGSAASADPYYSYVCVSLINPDGTAAVQQPQKEVRVSYGVQEEGGYLSWAPETALLPLSVVSAGRVFGRIPGVYCAVNWIPESHLEHLRDQQSLWTGDLVPFRGGYALLVANAHRYSLISLKPEDWP